MTFIVLWKIKDDILKNVDNQTISFPIGFHNVDRKYNGSQWDPKMFDYKCSLKYLVSYSIKFGLEQNEG